MKKFKTKKAYTLVELVVTVAILSITAGMGVGIFASALRNYSQASVTAHEQDKATEIESFLLRYARVCKYFYYIDGMSGETEISPDAHEVYWEELFAAEESESQYMIMYPNSTRLEYKVNDKDEEGNAIPSSPMYVEGVENIEVKISKQKLTSEESENNIFYFMNYKISMEEGYTLKGTAILYNVANLSADYSNSYIEDVDDGSFKMGKGTVAKHGLGFLGH